MEYNDIKNGSEMMWARYCFLSNRLDRIEKSAFRNTVLVAVALLMITAALILTYSLLKPIVEKEVPNVEISVPQSTQTINDV